MTEEYTGRKSERERKMANYQTTGIRQDWMTQRSLEVTVPERNAQSSEQQNPSATDRHITVVAQNLPHTNYDILGMRVLKLSSVQVKNACPQVKSEFLAAMTNLEKYLNQSNADIRELRERCQCGVDGNLLSDRVMQEFQGKDSVTEELLSNLALVMRSSNDWVEFCISELDLEDHEIERPSGNPPNLRTVREVLYMWRNVNNRQGKNTAKHLLDTLKTAEQKNMLRVKEAVEALKKELYGDLL